MDGNMDLIVAVTIGVLALVFILAILILIVLICKQRQRKVDLLSAQHDFSKPNVELIGAIESGLGAVELDDVQIMPECWENMLHDDNWIDDVSGTIPHCIAILKTCHELAEKLVAVTMRQGSKYNCIVQTSDVVIIAKRISPRVDDVITAMFPPLDPKLLEARCTALVLSVNHLALITKEACHVSGTTDWIDQSLLDVEQHLVYLRLKADTFHAQ